MILRKFEPSAAAACVFENILLFLLLLLLLLSDPMRRFTFPYKMFCMASFSRGEGGRETEVMRDDKWVLLLLRSAAGVVEKSPNRKSQRLLAGSSKRPAARYILLLLGAIFRSIGRARPVCECQYSTTSHIGSQTKASKKAGDVLLKCLKVKAADFL